MNFLHFNKKSHFLIASIIFIFTYQLALLITPLQRSAYAQDASAFVQCDDLSMSPDSDFSNWDWPKKIKESASGFTPFPDFDKSNSHYIMFKTPAQKDLHDSYGAAGNQGTESSSYPNNTWNQTSVLVLTDNSKRPYLSSPNGIDIFYTAPSGVSFRMYTIVSGSNDANKYISSGTTYTQYLMSTGNMGCFKAMVNSDYSTNWIYRKDDIDTDMPSGGDVSCSTLDIACHVGQLFSGVAETFKAVGQAIVQGIGLLFIPDGDKIKSDIDDFNTWLNNKLGFLAYPVVFFSDMFNAYNDTSNQWCTSTSCSKDFGSFLGGDFTLNLLEPKETMPTLWTWFTAMLRGLLVLGLVIAVKRKASEVLSQ